MFFRFREFPEFSRLVATLSSGTDSSFRSMCFFRSVDISVTSMYTNLICSLSYTWFLRSGEVGENQSTSVQKLTKMQKETELFLRLLRTTVQKIFLLTSHADYFYLHF